MVVHPDRVSLQFWCVFIGTETRKKITLINDNNLMSFSEPGFGNGITYHVIYRSDFFMAAEYMAKFRTKRRQSSRKQFDSKHSSRNMLAIPPNSTFSVMANEVAVLSLPVLHVGLLLDDCSPTTHRRHGNSSPPDLLVHSKRKFSVITDHTRGTKRLPAVRPMMNSNGEGLHKTIQ